MVTYVGLIFGNLANRGSESIRSEQAEAEATADCSQVEDAHRP